jgi:hypothetical protein
MSWLFSRAAAEEFSGESSLDGEPFAQLNVSITPHAFWRKGKMMDASTLSLFGQTSRVLTVETGEALLMSFLAAFRAKTSALPARVPESTATAAPCGDTWRELLATWSPPMRYWKTAQCSLLADSEAFSGTWPRWGLMRNGECYRLEQPASLTSAIGYGSSLPTPSGVNGGTNNTMGRVDEWGGSSNPLRGTVIGSMCLPEFEELVMGWPVRWTALTPYETGKFQEWQQQHGEF